MSRSSFLDYIGIRIPNNRKGLVSPLNLRNSLTELSNGWFNKTDDDAEDVAFSDPSFAATNVKDAITEVQASTTTTPLSWSTTIDTITITGEPNRRFAFYFDDFSLVGATGGVTNGYMDLLGNNIVTVNKNTTESFNASGYVISTTLDGSGSKTFQFSDFTFTKQGSSNFGGFLRFRAVFLLPHNHASVSMVDYWEQKLVSNTIDFDVSTVW